LARGVEFMKRSTLASSLRWSDRGRGAARTRRATSPRTTTRCSFGYQGLRIRLIAAAIQTRFQRVGARSRARSRAGSASRALRPRLPRPVAAATRIEESSSSSARTSRLSASDESRYSVWDSPTPVLLTEGSGSFASSKTVDRSSWPLNAILSSARANYARRARSSVVLSPAKSSGWPQLICPTRTTAHSPPRRGRGGRCP